MAFLRQIGAIIWKDVLAEWRRREILSSMFIFSLLVILIFNFSFELRLARAEALAPGVLWVAFAFAGTLGLSRSFNLEKEKGGLEALLLSPAERSTIYFGKFLGNTIFMSFVEAITLPFFLVLFNLALPNPWLFAVIFLGTVGFSGVGTLLSAIAVNSRAREMMLPILLFPVALPLLIAAIHATGAILDGLGPSEWLGWMQFLAAFDAIFLSISYMTFEYVVEE